MTELIGDPVNGSIHVDESGFPKQGTESVGVARQYCGRLGKVENCQVGVFLGYANGAYRRRRRCSVLRMLTPHYRTLIDEALYLPTSWAEDWKRREKCGASGRSRIQDDKPELALEMIFPGMRYG